MKADRIDLLASGGYMVIDYKTSKQPATKKEEMTSVQIPSYGLWIRQKINKHANISGAYFYLRHMASKKGVHSHVVTNEWMETTTAKYVDIYSQIQNGCAYIPQKNKFCGYCDYRLPCSSNFGFK
jgi:RecB family exonuclease